MRIFKAAVISISSIFVISCSVTSLNEHDLTRVAKDWSMVVRASQVIPVYPLTEDLQPGDILLVSTPIEEQVEEYRKRGFLPLDQLLKRLNPTDAYKEFYGARYGMGDKSKLPPSIWQYGSDNKPQWNNAPRVSFPSYGFSVSTDKGLNLALPVSGVPTALGLMNSTKASGSVTLTDAFTYGLDNVSLTKEVNEWANGNRLLLKSFGPIDDQHQFLRVITRVFVVSEVSINIFSLDEKSAGLEVDSFSRIETLSVDKSSGSKSLSKAASVSYKALSDKSVAVKERFEKPLVLGYLGFDFPILEDGTLGAPISTLARLNNKNKKQKFEYSDISPYKNASLALIFEHLNRQSSHDAEVQDVLIGLNRLVYILPEKYFFNRYSDVGSGIKIKEEKFSDTFVDKNDFEDVISYLGVLEQNLRVCRSGKLPEAENVCRAMNSEYFRVMNFLSDRGEVRKAINVVFN